LPSHHEQNRKLLPIFWIRNYKASIIQTQDSKAKSPSSANTAPA
jgi:hypothetical protein